MKAKLAGLVLLSGMSLAAQAATYHFTPITQPANASAQSTVASLGNQLGVSVTDAGNNTALFTFTNNGGITSSLSEIYFDDSPSSLFSNISVQGGNGSSFQKGGASALPGGNIGPYNFNTTQYFSAGNGVDSGSGGESVTLAGTLNSGKTFVDVVNSLNGGNETNTGFLRIGLRLSAIAGGIRDDYCGCGISFLDKGTGTTDGGASPPPPIPEPETYGMLLAGLGLVSAMARRRKQS